MTTKRRLEEQARLGDVQALQELLRRGSRHNDAVILETCLAMAREHHLEALECQSIDALLGCGAWSFETALRSAGRGLRGRKTPRQSLAFEGARTCLNS